MQTLYILRTHTSAWWMALPLALLSGLLSACRSAQPESEKNKSAAQSATPAPIEVNAAAASTRPIHHRCTEIACLDAVHVRFAQALPVPYKISLRTENPNQRGTFLCDGNSPIEIEGNVRVEWCDARYFVVLGNPEALEINYQNALTGLSVRMLILPTYLDVFPNGPECPGHCLAANVLVDLTGR